VQASLASYLIETDGGATARSQIFKSSGRANSTSERKQLPSENLADEKEPPTINAGAGGTDAKTGQRCYQRNVHSLGRKHGQQGKFIEISEEMKQASWPEITGRYAWWLIALLEKGTIKECDLALQCQWQAADQFHGRN